MPEMIRIEWFGCYDNGWQSAPLTPEAYSHPAKISFGLAERIYRHMLAEGWLKPGDRVLDPFGGIGGTAFHAALYGLHWTGIELEQPFVDCSGGCECTGFTKADWRRFFGRFGRARYLCEQTYWNADDNSWGVRVRHICPDCMKAAQQIGKSRIIPERAPHHYTGNLDLWRARYAPHFPGYGSARVLQGDSRRLAEIVAAADACVSSPPFQSSLQNSKERSGLTFGNARYGHKDTVTDMIPESYGSTPGQLGALPAGSFAAALADGVVSSPPYADAGKTGGDSGDPQKYQRKFGGSKTSGRSMIDGTYGATPGQLGAMPAGNGFDATVSSPPYASGTVGGGDRIDWDKAADNSGRASGKITIGDDYGA